MLSYSLLKEDVLPRAYGFCIIHLQHHFVSTGYATKTKQKKALQANPFNTQKWKTVVQAEWKNWISLAAFRAGIIGMSWGADGCPLRYRYQVCQINLGKKKKKKNKEKCLSLQPCLTNASNLIRYAERTKRHPTRLTETEKTLIIWTWRMLVTVP